MASKSQMFQLLRLLDYSRGCMKQEIRDAACRCWRGLSAETQQAMTLADGADGKRARIWYAAWEGAVSRELEVVRMILAEGRTVGNSWEQAALTAENYIITRMGRRADAALEMNDAKI